MTTPSGYVRFSKRSDGWYYYVPANKEEDEYLKNFAKSTGLISCVGSKNEKKESSVDVEKSAPKASAKSPSNTKKK